MEKELIFYRGISGLGKSTIASEMKSLSEGVVEVIERDMIRRDQNIKNESRVTDIQKDMIVKSKANQIIISDTNLNEQYFGQFVRWAESHGYGISVNDYRGSNPVEALDLFYKAIKQDVGRQYAVGEKVIRNQFFNHIAPNHFYKGVEGNQKVVIVDIDGTVADIRHRGPYETGEILMKDKPNEEVLELVRYYAGTGRRILFFSGRQDTAREVTERWLRSHTGFTFELYMRKDGDNRKDYAIKHDIFEEVVAKNGLNVVAVFDDRTMMRDYWNTRGLNLFSLERGTIF